MTTTTRRSAARTMEGRFRSAGARVDRLIERLDAVDEEVWKTAAGRIERLVAEIDGEMSSIDARVAVARSELEVGAAVDEESYFAAIRSELEAWRTLIDELQVRAALARMDVRDQVKASIAAAREAYEFASNRFLQTGKGSVAAIRDDLKKALEDLRRTVEEARRKVTAAQR